MKPFKFLSEENTHISITTLDTPHTSYLIPRNMYGDILEKGLEIYNRFVIEPTSITEYTMGSEMVGYISYQYSITSVSLSEFNPSYINIRYCVKFQGTEHYRRFKTIKNLF